MWLIQQMQITHPEQGTTATATQACEDTPAPLQSLRHGTDMPNPTASSSPLSQLLPARTGTALRYQLKTQKKAAVDFAAPMHKQPEDLPTAQRQVWMESLQVSLLLTAHETIHSDLL